LSHATTHWSPPDKGPAAADFDRPLLLTPGQDLAGWLGRRIGRTALTIVAVTSVAAVLLIFVYVIIEAAPFLKTRGLGELFTRTGWYPEATPRIFGGLALFYGSAMVTVTSMLIAVPLGLLGAVFLSDIAPFKVRQAVKPVIEILAAIPSVAFGFFAIKVLGPWMHDHLGIPSPANMFSASILLAIMALPTIVSIAEDSLTAVGRDLREAGYALGATRAECVVQVVIPAAHSGIIAAVILGTMRAVGETMVVLMAAGNASQIASPWWDLTQAARTLTATIAQDMGETERGGPHYRALFTLGLILLTITLVLNLASGYFLNRVKRVRKEKPK
jgi:phosphate transport system permease protein